MITSDVLGKKMALVVVDAQRKFRNDRPDWDEACSAAVAAMDRLMFMFRSVGAPVVAVRFGGDTPCRPYDGDDGDEYYPGLAIRPCDTVVSKTSMNAFNGTDLKQVLDAYGCDMILICGAVTQYCVMATYFGSMEHDVVPYLAHGATISTADEIVSAGETVCKTMTEETVSKVLGCEVPAEGTVPISVTNVFPEWDDSLLFDIAALANSGGGHFVIGYPKGVREPEALAQRIRRLASEELGINVDAETIEFCCNRSVEVNVEKSDGPVLFGGLKFTAMKDYSYR